MQDVNRIACVNAAGFVQEFRVIWDGGRTDLSPAIRIFSQEQLI